MEAHSQHLTSVLSLLRDHLFFVKLSKCSFCCTTVEYLGHLVTDGLLKADPAKIEAMTAWPTPTTIKQLRGFLGLTGYYQRFVVQYAMIVAPLTELLKKDSFAWTQEAEVVFDKLKLAMSTAPVLSLPNFTKTFYIETDVLDVGIGVVLIQHKHPIAYFSKKLGPRRRISSTYHKELYAIIEAVQKWRHYLLGREFMIQSDQKSLKDLLQQVVQMPDQHFYVRKLLGYKFHIEYKKGSTNKAADVLSRREESELPLHDTGVSTIEAADSLVDDTTSMLSVVSQPIPSLLEDLHAETTSLSDLVALVQQIQEGKAPSHLAFVDGLVFYDRRILLSPSSAFKAPLLHEYHSSPLAGHPGFERTFRLLSSCFY